VSAPHYFVEKMITGIGYQHQPKQKQQQQRRRQQQQHN
jgi:hypothetical protein